MYKEYSYVDNKTYNRWVYISIEDMFNGTIGRRFYLYTVAKNNVKLSYEKLLSVKRELQRAYEQKVSADIYFWQRRYKDVVKEWKWCVDQVKESRTNWKTACAALDKFKLQYPKIDIKAALVSH